MEVIKREINVRDKIFYGFLIVTNDIVFLSLSCFLAYYLRFYTKFFGSRRPPTYTVDNKYIIYSLIFIGIVIAISFLIRLYSFNLIYRDPVYYLKILTPPVLSIISVIIIGRDYESFPFSKIWIETLIVLSLFLMFFSRYFVAIITKKIFVKSGYYNIEILAGFN